MEQLIETESAVKCGRVLVVDDVPANVRLLEAYLKSEGYEVRTASGGREALERIADSAIDLVLLDVMMPQLNGFDTCQMIKEDPATQHIPVILVTSLNDLQDKVLGQQAGADDFISKPFNRVELLLRVKSMIRIKKLNDQLNGKIDELEQAKTKLSRLANTDGLTSLHNKRYLEEFMLRELDRAERHRHKLTLLMLDIDHFKCLNDTHGHQTGDILLQQMATLFTQNIRSIDLAARYGGEEFALVLLETDKKGGGSVAENLRSAVESHAFLDGRAQPVGSMTVSIGVATYPEDATGTHELIEVADRRLYAAKRAGRNQVVLQDE